MDSTQTVKRRSPVLTLFIILILIIFVATCGVVGALGFAYYSNNSRFNNFINPNSNNNSNSSGNIQDFYSSSEYKAESDLIRLVEQSQPAVVTVTVKASQNLRDRNNLRVEERRTIGSGTGFFISNDGLLITNEHVVCGARASDLVIITADQKTYTVTNLATDPSQDVAILKVNTNNESVKSLKFANPNTQIKVGQEVVAIGNPFGDNPGTVTRGIISGLNRNISAQGSCDGENQLKDYEGVLQTDAAINSGNSGGPLLDSKGEVIGVNSATLRGANNISYTVPFTTVTRILDNYLKNDGKIVSPFIGVTHTMISPESSQRNNVPVGALVSSVSPNSPAAQAGIRAGDIITKIGDKEINFSLVSTLNLNFTPNQKTTIEVYRSDNEDLSNGRRVTLNITIGQRE